MAAVETNYLDPSARGVCGGCREQVSGDMLTCRGRVYHVGHFQCNGCKKSLGTESFHYKDNDSQYCESCYLNNLTPSCITCEKPITSRHTYWNGAPYHLDCFVCSRCDEQINTEQFAVVNSAPFCLSCEGNSAHDDRESTSQRVGVCSACQRRGTDNFCEGCGEPLNF